VLKADTASLAARAASYVLAPGKAMTFTDLYLTRHSKTNDAGQNKHLLETLSGTAKSVAVTA
jgi:hypothetical protein